MIPLRHELIRASAGTGKTYQLTLRYLQILFATQEPEKAIALTFTRKAAGEFFEKIFRRLADAAESPKNAALLGGDLGLTVTVDQCRANLRLLLERLHRLQLSTYDSFFTRVVQTFPFELGLAGPPTLLDDDQRVQAILRAQQALSRRTQLDEPFLREFWHACKRASLGAEMKTITEVVTRFILENQALFFDASAPECWGTSDRIWEGGCAWACGDLDLAEEARRLQDALDWTALAEPQVLFWRELIAELSTWRPPIEMPKRTKYFLGQALPCFADLESGTCTINVNRKKQVLAPAVGASLKRIVQFIAWTIVHGKLEVTRGIFDLVRLFEEIYRHEVRLMGQLTLEDATRLLCGGPTHGRGLADPEMRDLLGYRLDGSFDHWLLDEFQDTSRVQWRAVSDLIDEILQDPEGRRSFFAVGDTKQSLYGWRGSDPRLFDEIHDRYADVLHVRELNKSYRSCPAVLAMTNAVFGQKETIAELCTPALAERWAGMWQEHTSADHLANQPGFSCLLHAPENDEPCFETVLGLLKELSPLEKGLSVAVLTRKNDVAEALVEYLRTNGGPPCSLAANVRPGTDSALAAGLRSFLTVAAHPQDTLAWNHLRMTPLGMPLEERHRTAAALSAHLLEIWSEQGLVGLADEWIRLCHGILATDDAFNRGRLESCRRAALALEARGETDIDAYVRQLGSLELRENDTPGQVAVMTVHKAKGLDWDVVILTDLAGNTLLQRRDGLEVHRGGDGEILWVLDMPASDIAKHDSVLGARIAAAQEDAAFENLCVLYVALTRAKRGLYVVTHPGKPTSANFHRLLDETLGAKPHDLTIGDTTFCSAWQHGNAAWISTLGTPVRVDHAPAALPSISPEQQVSVLRPRARRPSAGEIRKIPGRTLFQRSTDQRDIGIAAHEALSRIEWLSGDEANENAAIETALAGTPASAAEAIRRLFASDEIRQAFRAPTHEVTLWREKPFELLSGDQWISGRFDRVVIRRNRASGGDEATVLDLKVHAEARDSEALVSQYRVQMDLYRAALAELLGIDPKRIAAYLLSTTASSGAPARLLPC
ncbi:hypothetical protein DB347_19780 [Opitutaceae bacterium EW11]|nr:hypothetical protein DB347_19780 [Opitutaceae bacterium EW11]